MRKKRTDRTKNLVALLLLVFLAFSCANRGQGPQGGPKDETPPVPIKSTPEQGALNFTGKKIEIEFDENITLKDIMSNVIVSPPQRTMPEIKGYGKKLYFTFNDTLQEDATYSIDFGNAIVDNNEGNILRNYVFAFSTGDYLDSLRLSGTLLNAEDLNPVESIIVGIHSDLNDTAFFTKPFDRIARSDNEGRFTVHNVKQNKFRVYALDDLNRDNIYQQGEAAAYTADVFETSSEPYLRQDTLWADSITIDTIMTVNATRFLPDDIMLRYFKSEKKRQYLVKTERTVPHKFTLIFNTKNDSLPIVKPLDIDWSDKFVLQENPTRDTLNYWLTDSLLIKMDTLRLQVDYLKSDSLMELQAQTDTIRALFRSTARARSKDDDKKSDKIEFLPVISNASGRFDLYKNLEIEFETPIKSFDLSRVKLSQRSDTLYLPREFKINKSDSTGMKYHITYPWEPENSYKLEIDSAAIENAYGLHNDKVNNEFNIRAVEEYATLILTFEKYDSAMVVQVLDRNDKVQRTIPVTVNPLEIKYLNPGDYFLRLFIDHNRNGKWDTGDVDEDRQPEEVYYYNKKLTLIDNWDFEESWNHTLLPLDKQKPEEIRKPVNKKQ